MPTEPKKPLIVISYAHAAEPEYPAEGEVKWLSFVTGYLRPAIKHGAVELWIDRLMPGGADWEQEIGEKLRACDIFILLVSRHSLSSDYVVDKEIAIIRERQRTGEPVHFYPLVLTPTPKIALDLVSDKNLRPRDGRPLSDYTINERYRQIADVADEIALTAERAVSRNGALSMAGQPSTASGIVAVPESQVRRGPFKHKRSGAIPEIKNRESAQDWLKNQSTEAAIVIAARAALRVLPVALRAARSRGRTKKQRQLLRPTSAIFRAAAVAWVAGRYKPRFTAFQPAAHSAAFAAADAAFTALPSEAIQAVSRAALAAAFADSHDIVSFAAEAAAAADVADVWDNAIVHAIEHDIKALQQFDPENLAELPLWLNNVPKWATDAWAALRAALPKSEVWYPWIDWYEQRLRGGSRREEYELVFVNVPREEWEKGPAAANAWIKAHLPSRLDEGWKGRVFDRESLEAWLKGQSRRIAIALAARAALRVAPLAVRSLQSLPAKGNPRVTSAVTSAVLRAAALARLVTKYPTQATELRSAAEEAVHAADVYSTSAAAAASASARAAAYSDADADVYAAVAAAEAVAVAAEATANSAGDVWEATRADLIALQTLDTSVLPDLPLWPLGAPEWANHAWTGLQAALSEGEYWDVWIDWYEERLRGGFRGEEYELVFASVLQEEWEKGPAAANAWIKAHLPNAPYATLAANLPEPVANVESPWAML